MLSARQLCKEVIGQVISTYTSIDVCELIESLAEKRNLETIADMFCTVFELGGWFLETMIVNEIDVCEVLQDIREEKRASEDEAADLRKEIEEGLRG